MAPAECPVAWEDLMDHELLTRAMALADTYARRRAFAASHPFTREKDERDAERARDDARADLASFLATHLGVGVMGEAQPSFWESAGDWTDDPHVADGWKLEVEAGVRSSITPLYTHPPHGVGGLDGGQQWGAAMAKLEEWLIGRSGPIVGLVFSQEEARKLCAAASVIARHAEHPIPFVVQLFEESKAGVDVPLKGQQ
jgi:hypothetical protein